MEYTEDEYLMISGIQHFKFCRRQWALIHVEQQWAENVHTVTGELMHKKAHDPYLTEKRKDTIIVRALPVSSRELGISGECDVVEFQKCEDGIQLHGHRGLYSVFPVEYKKGKPKLTEEDKLQVGTGVMSGGNVFDQSGAGSNFLWRNKKTGADRNYRRIAGRSNSYVGGNASILCTKVYTKSETEQSM